MKTTIDSVFEHYDRLHGTADELDIFHFWILEEECKKREVEIVYYRQVKPRHIPMSREFKIKGRRGDVLMVVDYLKKERLLHETWRNELPNERLWRNREE